MGDVGGIAQAGASVVDTAMSVSAQRYAADQASSATKYASDETSKTAANSLAFNAGVYNQTHGDETLYRDAGNNAAYRLNTGLTDGSLTAAYPGGDFHFSGVDLKNDPAYQFDLDQGQQAIQRSAAAQGGLVSGGALKDLDTYTQGYASNQYQQSYANALAAYQQSYNQFETLQGNTFNRLASVAGLGQNAVTQTATSGASAAATNAGVNSSTANTLAGLATSNASMQGAAAIGTANSLSNGVNGVTNALAGMSGSSYNGASVNTTNITPVNDSAWSQYESGSTPAGYRDAL